MKKSGMLTTIANSGKFPAQVKITSSLYYSFWLLSDMCRAGKNGPINNDARIDVGLFEDDFVEASEDSRLGQGLSFKVSKTFKDKNNE